jgi:hypothetical protein
MTKGGPKLSINSALPQGTALLQHGSDLSLRSDNVDSVFPKDSVGAPW